MTKPNNKTRPSHVAYAVEGDGETAQWTEIGALWPHSDQNGFNLNLRALPANGRLVIRTRKTRQAPGGAK